MSAGNRGGNAAKWNRLESLPTNSAFRCRAGVSPRQRSCRAGPYPGGPSNPWGTLGALPHRGHPKIFRDSFSGNFSGGWGAGQKSGAFRVGYRMGVSHRVFFLRQYFSRNQDSQTAARRLPNRNRVHTRTWRLAPQRQAATAIVSSRIFFRHAIGAPGGRSRVLELHAYDRVAGARIFPRNSENFFLSRTGGRYP